MRSGKDTRVLTGTSGATLLRAMRSGVIATLLARLVSLFSLPYILGVVGPTVYGVWAAISTVLAIGALADAGVRTEIMRRVGEAKGREQLDEAARSVQEGMTVLLLLVAPLLIISVAVAPLLRAALFTQLPAGLSSGDLDWMIRCVFGLLAISVFTHAYFGALSGLQRSDLETWGAMFGAIVTVFVTVVLVRNGAGIRAFFGGMVAGLLSESGAYLVFIRRTFPQLRFRLARMKVSSARALLGLSGLVLVSRVADIVDSQWDKLVITRVVGSAAVAQYHIGTLLVRQASLICLIPLAPLFVVIAELGRKSARGVAITSLLSRVSLSLASVLLSAAFVFAPAFIHLWLGPGYEDAARAARLFAIASYLNLLATPLSYIAFGEGRHRLVAIGAGANMIVNGALSLVLTLAIGFEGALYGSIAGMAAGLVVITVLSGRHVNRPRRIIPWRAGVLGVAAAAAAMAVGLGGPGYSWLVLIGGAGAYASVVGILCVASERLPVWSLLTGGIGAISVAEGRPSVPGIGG